MTFGFGDVCTRANGRGEKGGDEAAEGKTVPQAISQLSHHSLPPGRREGGGTTRGGYVVVSGRWLARRRRLAEDGAGGCFRVAGRGAPAAAGMSGKISKNERASCWVSRAPACSGASRMQACYKCTRRVRITQEPTSGWRALVPPKASWSKATDCCTRANVETSGAASGLSKRDQSFGNE